MSCRINWNINIERGNYDDDNHFEAQIRFNEGESEALNDRIQKLLEYLVEEGVMDHPDHIDEDDDEDLEYDDDIIEEHE